MHTYLEKFNIKNDGKGTYSDIATISKATNIPSVNLGIGYRWQHTAEEFLDTRGMHLMIGKASDLLTHFPKEGFGVIEERVQHYTFKDVKEKQVVRDVIYVRTVEDETQPELPIYQRRVSMDWCTKCNNWLDQCRCICYHCDFEKWECRCKAKSIGSGL